MSDAYRHNGDHELLGSLGLRQYGFGRDWTALGTVTLEKPNAGAGRPAATVEVEVCALPAQFWRFTITRPVWDEGSESYGTEQHVMTTGSGGFSDFWHVAKLAATNMIVLTRA